MTSEDITRIEEALEVLLPEEYRSVMTRTDSKESGFWYGGVYNDPARIIRDTQSLRETTESFKQPCPKSWVVVAMINGGDLAFIDTSEANAPLRYWNHESLQVEPCTDTVKHFVDSTLESLRDR